MSKPELATRLSPSAGVSLKPEHFHEAASYVDKSVWYEVHPENYFVSGGERLDGLLSVAENNSISLHGVGASLGGKDIPDAAHIARVKTLVEMIDPILVSEHAVWSSHQGNYFAELLPLLRTREASQRLCSGIQAYQEGIGRRILVENPTNYLNFVSEMDEPDFLVEVAKISGCGLLLDINNLYLSSVNCGINAKKYIDCLPADLVGEIHIAGYTPDENNADLLIDSHAEPVSHQVWELLEYALIRLGPKHVLLERDANLPAFSELMTERDTAQKHINYSLGESSYAVA